VSSRGGSLLNKIHRLLALRRTIRKERPDVVVSFLPDVNIAAVIAAWGLSVPVVVSERIYPPAMPLGALLERLRRWIYPRADAVVVQTNHALQWLARCCPTADGHVIANPVVFPLPEAEPITAPSSVIGSQRRLVLAVGRLDPQKQFEALIAAFERLAPQFPEWDLVILGEGSERESLENQLEQLGLGGRVCLPGRVGNLSDWYARADLYVMSSRFEGFPNSLAEAMAYGLPAVSFDCDAGPRDIIREGVDGCLVPPAMGVTGLSQAMETLMSDQAQREKMAEAAEAVRWRFSMERIAAKWDAVLGLTKASDV
jgi:glycosyltransferase involved in cell wall biosynthesis